MLFPAGQESEKKRGGREGQEDLIYKKKKKKREGRMNRSGAAAERINMVKQIQLLMYSFL